jgi:hypothetical protein
MSKARAESARTNVSIIRDLSAGIAGASAIRWGMQHLRRLPTIIPKGLTLGFVFAAEMAGIRHEQIIKHQREHPLRGAAAAHAQKYAMTEVISDGTEALRGLAATSTGLATGLVGRATQGTLTHTILGKWSRYGGVVAMTLYLQAAFLTNKGQSEYNAKIAAELKQQDQEVPPEFKSSVTRYLAWGLAASSTTALLVQRTKKFGSMIPIHPLALWVAQSAGLVGGLQHKNMAQETYLEQLHLAQGTPHSAPTWEWYSYWGRGWLAALNIPGAFFIDKTMSQVPPITASLRDGFYPPQLAKVLGMTIAYANVAEFGWRLYTLKQENKVAAAPPSAVERSMKTTPSHYPALPPF